MKVYNLQLALKEPEKVTELFLHNLGINTFPKEILAFKNLKKLDLSQNKLKEIPSEIANLITLESLVFSDNEITSLPDELSKLSKLKVINLQNNPLSNIPKVIFQLKNLRLLQLSNTKIEKVDSEIGRLPNLEILDLSENNISRLPKSFGKLIALKKLFFQKNKFRKLPEELCQAKQLVVFDASFNRLKTLSEEFGNLRKLETLELQNNHLTSLPESIDCFTFLRNLNISFNKIESLPVSFFRLKQLRILNCSKNRIAHLPSNFGCCTSLRQVNLNKNLLAEFPKSLNGLHFLEKLEIAENQLIELPDAFQSMNRLKTMELKKNKIRSLPESLKHRTSLHYLGLANNPIVLVPEHLLGLENLEKFNGKVGIDPVTKRTLLQFLKSCKKWKIPSEFRIPFYQLINEVQVNIPLNILLEALCFRNQAIQKNALESILKYHNQQEQLKKGHVLGFVGKTHFNLEEITPILIEAEIKIASELTKEVSHVVLGFNPTNQDLLQKTKFTFLSEKELNEFIKTIRTKNLRSLSPLELEKVSVLLTSEHSANIEIAIQILKDANNQLLVLTELFIAYKIVKDKKMKTNLRTLLAQNLSEASMKILNLPLGINAKKIDSKRLEGTINQLAFAGLDTKKITLFLESG